MTAAVYTLPVTEHLTTDEAAEALGLSPFRVREMIRQGTLQATRTGGRWTIPTDAVDELITARESGTRNRVSGRPLRPDPRDLLTEHECTALTTAADRLDRAERELDHARRDLRHLVRTLYDAHQPPRGVVSQMAGLLGVQRAAVQRYLREARQETR